MQCPACKSNSTKLLKAKTLLGYLRFRCVDCNKKFNERTGTPFNFLTLPTDVVLLVVKWRFRYKLSFRDLAEMFDMAAAKAFLKKALKTIGEPPDRVTTDKHSSYPRAIREELGKSILHRTNQYLNNYTEQSHRGIKQRYYPMRGFGAFKSAKRFCKAFEELQDFFRPKARSERISLARRRLIHRQRTRLFNQLIMAT